jgi:hypothetical protein
MVEEFSPGNPVKNLAIQKRVRGLQGRNAISSCLKKLPPALRKTIKTRTNGKSLRLPPLSEKGAK